MIVEVTREAEWSLLAHRDDDALMANRRFRGIADMDRFLSRNDL